MQEIVIAHLRTMARRAAEMVRGRADDDFIVNKRLRRLFSGPYENFGDAAIMIWRIESKLHQIDMENTL